MTWRDRITRATVGRLSVVALLCALMGAAASGADASPSSPDAAVHVPTPSPESTRYHVGNNRIWAFAQLWSLAVPAFLVFSGYGGRLARWCERRARGRWVLACVLFTLCFVAISALAELPLGFFVGYLRQRAYGLSNQSLGRWASHRALNLGLGAGLWALCAPLVYLFLRRSPRRWWLWTGLVTVPLMLFGAFITPLAIDPLFNKFSPIQDPELRAEIQELADRCHMGDAQLFQVDRSRDTRALNAYVTGLMGSHRVVLWDTLIQRLDRPEVLAIVGHEMGHYVLGHVWRGLMVAAILTLVGLFAVDRAGRALVRRYGPKWGIPDLLAVASLPLLVTLARVASLLLVPMGNAYSRHIEFEADRFALELTRLNQPAARAFVAFHETNLSYPEPGNFYRILRATHPSLGARIRFCNSYQPWREGGILVYSERFEPSDEDDLQPRGSAAP